MIYNFSMLEKSIALKEERWMREKDSSIDLAFKIKNLGTEENEKTRKEEKEVKFFLLWLPQPECAISGHCFVHFLPRRGRKGVNT